jgi:hypothetical protein
LRSPENIGFPGFFFARARRRGGCAIRQAPENADASGLISHPYTDGFPRAISNVLEKQ